LSLLWIRNKNTNETGTFYKCLVQLISPDEIYVLLP
jgi:hypothetical protein